MISTFKNQFFIYLWCTKEWNEDIEISTLYLLLLVRASQQDWSKNSCYCSSCYLYLGFFSIWSRYTFIQHPNIFILEKLVRILGTGSFELHNSQVLISDPTIETKLLATKRDLLDRRYFYFVFIIWHCYCKICNSDTLFSIFSNIQYYIQS